MKIIASAKGYFTPDTLGADTGHRCGQSDVCGKADGEHWERCGAGATSAKPSPWLADELGQEARVAGYLAVMEKRVPDLPDAAASQPPGVRRVVDQTRNGIAECGPAGPWGSLGPTLSSPSRARALESPSDSGLDPELFLA